jgi:hypothetical protein
MTTAWPTPADVIGKTLVLETPAGPSPLTVRWRVLGECGGARNSPTLQLQNVATRALSTAVWPEIRRHLLTYELLIADR